LASFPYNPEFVSKVKSIDGYRWHPDKKYWSFPYFEKTLKRLLLAFKNENIYVDSNVQVPFEQKFDKQISNQVQVAEAVKKEFKLRGYSQRTQKAYLHHIGRYINYFAKCPKSLMKIILNSICSI
jgi:hypothetical protein